MKLKLILISVFAEMPPVVNLLKEIFDLSERSQLLACTAPTDFALCFGWCDCNAFSVLTVLLSAMSPTPEMMRPASSAMLIP